jgi:hypothetical protein
MSISPLSIASLFHAACVLRFRNSGNVEISVFALPLNFSYQHFNGSSDIRSAFLPDDLHTLDQYVWQ